MTDRESTPMLTLLQGGACIVIILWGVSRRSHLVSLVLLSILLACCNRPLPEWFMRRFKLGKSAAIGLAAALMGTLDVVIVFMLYQTILRLRAELPVYEQRFMALNDSVLVFLNGHGIHLANLSSTQMSTSDWVIKLIPALLPHAASFLSDSLLVILLALIFLSAMVEEPGATKGRLGETMRYYSDDAQRYIVITAKTNGIFALASLVLFLVLGVPFPVIWCVLGFFLRFIPSLGFFMALIPPTFVTLLVFGWRRAALVAGGLILISLIVDYVINPILMREGVNVSFLVMMLSLVFWGSLLGLSGGILAIPLTLALRKFVDKRSHDGESARVPLG